MCQIPPADDKPTGLLLSGGLDSCILLGHLIARGHRVRPIYVDSDLVWQGPELRALRQFLAALGGTAGEDLAVLELPLADIYEDHWSVTGYHVPGAKSPDEAVYMPGRNPLLLVKAAVWCGRRGIERLAIGVLGTSPFADAKTEFFSHFEAAMNLAIEGRLELLRPFAGATKLQVMRLGRGMPLEWTFSCIAPMDGQHCGQCNKCAERRQAFRLAGIDDPTEYAADHVST